MTGIERAARALALRFICEQQDREPSDEFAAQYADSAWPSHVEQVRAVIAAIREPSEGMVKAAVLSTVEIWDEERNAEREFKTEFAAAIDKLLKEGGGP